MTATLVRDHPYLRAAQFGPDAVSELLDAGRIALFLDGLDELPSDLRAQAVDKVQQAPQGLRFVLTSRRNEFHDVVQVGGPLPNTVVLELGPVSPRTAADFLVADQFAEDAARWRRIGDQIVAHPTGPLARALSTPLMLTLARAAFPPGADPAALMSDDLATEEALRAHLLDQVIVTAYPDARVRAHAAHWLGWLAGRPAAEGAEPQRDIRWWLVPALLPGAQWRVFRLLTGGLLGWLVVAFGVGDLLGTRVGVLSAIPVSILVALAAAFGRLAQPARLVVRKPAAAERRVAFSVALAVAVIVGPAVADSSGPWPGLIAGAGAAAVFGLALSFAHSTPAASSTQLSPWRSYRTDVLTTVSVCTVAPLLFALTGFTVAALLGPRAAAVSPADGGRLGLVVGVVGALAGLLRSACGQLWTAEVMLALSGRGAVRFMPLLETARQRNLLRQAGSAYEFRHADHQERLASSARSP